MIRPYVTESIGTLLLTLTITLTGNPLAAALMLTTLVYIGGHISGGHYNPAVSCAEYVHGHLSLKNLFYYGAAQVVGAIGGLVLFYMISHVPFSPELPAETSLSILFLMEALMTSVLCLTVLTVTHVVSLKNTPVYGAAIGLALGAIASIGGLFNPAIALGSFFVKLIYLDAQQTAELVWMHQGILIHTFAPLLGGAVAAWVFSYLNKDLIS